MKDYFVILTGANRCKSVWVRAQNEKGAVRRAIVKTGLFGKWNNASVCINKYHDWVDIRPDQI